MYTFGNPNFDLDNYCTSMLKESGCTQLIASQTKLKNSSRDISQEVGAFLFDHYTCFLRSKEAITQLHHSFLNLQTTIQSQYALTLNAIQQNLEQSEAELHIESVDQLDEQQDTIWEIEKQLEDTEILISQSEFEEADLALDKIRIEPSLDQDVQLELLRQVSALRNQLKDELLRYIKFSRGGSQCTLALRIGVPQSQIIQIYLGQLTTCLRKLI